jgi:cell division transport system permease protein
VDKEQALARYRRFAGQVAGLVDELAENPLPASIEVYLEPGESAVPLARQVAGKSRTSAAVEEVRFNGEWLERLEGVLRVVRFVGTGLAGVVLAATILVMASVLRLAVYQRREEIEIMLLVGAKPSFIRGPFLVTGVVQGLFASAFALGAVELMRYALVTRAGPATLAVVELLAARPLTPVLTAVVVLVGLAVSLTGSFFAVRPSY